MIVLRILIADDHPVFRDGLRAVLDATDGLEVVGEAQTGEEAVALTEELRPDLVLMDVQMPGINGIEATRRIARCCPETRVLIVTMFEDDATVFTAMRAGARGYVLKDAEKDEIRRAIEAVGSGEAIFSPAIASRLIAYFANPHLTMPQQTFPELTAREREILDLIARGENNGKIADLLGLSAKTVSNYVSTILNKLQVADRSEAIVRAKDAGFGSAP